MDLQIASAPDNWGVWFPHDEKQMPWQRFLDELVEAGYAWTELGPYGYLPTDATRLASELGARGLKVCGTFAMAPLEDPQAWPDVERQVLGGGELVAALGGKYLVLIDDLYSDPFTGQSIAPKRLDQDAWKRLVAAVHQVARLAKEQLGLCTVYHPHAETHIEYEDQIEQLLDETDPELVKLCLDTGHHAYRGGNPVAFLRKHHHRVSYLHLKSVDRQKRQQVEANQTPFATAVAEDVFCEPSKGAVDFVALRELLEELNFSGFAVVEQDMYPAPFDKPLPIARRTRKYLQEIGLG